MFGVRISSSTKCSNWPPKAQADTPTAPDPTRSLKVATLPVDTIPSLSQQPRQVSLLHSAPLIAVLRLDDVLVHSPREPYKFLLRADFARVAGILDWPFNGPHFD